MFISGVSFPRETYTNGPPREGPEVSSHHLTLGVLNNGYFIKDSKTNKNIIVKFYSSKIKVKERNVGQCERTHPFFHHSILITIVDTHYDSCGYPIHTETPCTFPINGTPNVFYFPPFCDEIPLTTIKLETRKCKE